MNTHSKTILSGLIVASGLALGATRVGASDGLISKTVEAEGSYCHLRFPAIVPSTLDTDHPQLKDASSGDIIDYYGPCDHDPVGKEEIETQEHDRALARLRDMD